MDSLAVLVVDADPLATRAMVRALDGETGIRVVATATDVAQAVQMAALRPDVILLDAQLASGEELETLSRLRDIDPTQPIMVLSSVDDDELAMRALRMGAVGFLPKALATGVMPRIVRAVGRGEAVLSRALTTKLVERLRSVPESGRGLRPVRSDLSSREWEVLDLICAGESTRSIAGELGLSIETVRSHVKHILRKLGAHSRAEAMKVAEQLLGERGLIPA
jgi:two-component system, NarL family, response regulator LiaR